MLEIAERFWSKVDKSGDCWEWQGARLKDGYGQMWLNGKVKRVHHVAWELTFGAIPDGLHVLHHCDNPPCVNPDHLWLGTPSDNHRDKAEKGRAAQGERHGSSKLKAIEVVRIRELSSSGRTGASLARLFGISRQQVCHIIHLKNWIRT